MSTKMADPFGAYATLKTAAGDVGLYRLDALTKAGIGNIDRLPFGLRVMLEAVMRKVDGFTVTEDHVRKLASWKPTADRTDELPFMPARVLMQDFTGVPAIVDLAAMRDALKRLGGDPKRINPLIPVDLVIDHSVQVDEFASTGALAINARMEFQRNRQRYEFLRWGQNAFQHFQVVPPATGIVHQVNLEYLAKVVVTRDLNGRKVAMPDTLVGTDSHTTMINGLGVLGWGVGGIEAEAALLGQPVYMLMPDVVGFRLSGRLPEGSTATDLVLTVTQMLRAKGVVGKFVEFFGDGLSALPLADRATIANMAPEYGATVGFFPVDDETLSYLRRTNRSAELVDLVERYCKEQGLFRTAQSPVPAFTDTLELNLATVEPSLAGPKRPQDRVPLHGVKSAFQRALTAPPAERGFGLSPEAARATAIIEDVPRAAIAAPTEQFTPPPPNASAGKGPVARLETEGPPPARPLRDEAVHHVAGNGHETLRNGHVIIAAITSCTNTSNPSVMVAAGLLAKKAVERGLEVKRYVKTSMAPGSKVVTQYLNEAGLTPYLDKLGFQTVGYGCTTCIGNSGPLPEPVAKAVAESDLVACAVLSGNRNFEGRIHPLVKANYLASPPLVVAYALAGTMVIDMASDPLGTGSDGKPVYLKDIWPSSREVSEAIAKAVKPEQFRDQYAQVFTGNEDWNRIQSKTSETYPWDGASTYIQNPPFFDDLAPQVGTIEDIHGARVLAILGDSITTDHISPAGAIKTQSPAGQYLREHGVEPADFNTYGARRGNDRVMTRGTFANIRLRNQLAPGTEGGVTLYLGPTTPSQSRDRKGAEVGKVMPIYDAAMKYKETNTPLLVLAGKEYGSGSSRDWAAKGAMLLGVRAVIAESYERIHRSNLVGMGVLPLQFKTGENAASLGLTGHETYEIAVRDVSGSMKPGQEVTVRAKSADGKTKSFQVLSRVDTPVEAEYYRNGGILQTVLRKFLSRPTKR